LGRSTRAAQHKAPEQDFDDMAEDETDIPTSAIKWLCDDPTFDPLEGGEMIRVALKSLGAEDPDDPLLVALVIEGVQAQRGGPLTPVPVAGWRPELCGDDPKRQGCNEPVSGTGRCMTCGSQRKQSEPEDAAIKAAQMSDKEPEDEEMTDAEALMHSLVEEAFDGDQAAALALDAHAFGVAIVGPDGQRVAPQDFYAEPPEPEPLEKIIFDRSKFDITAPTKRTVDLNRKLKLVTIKIAKVIPPPNPDKVQRHLDQMLASMQGDLPLLLRIKRATGMSDEELGAFLNRSRATIQAYAQGNRREALDAQQIKILRTVLELRRDMVGDLLIELEAMKCPSEN
jgi:hypothetical protein